MDSIQFGILGIGSGWAITAFGVLLIFRGKLVPKSTADSMEASYVRQIEDIAHDRDEWRASHRVSESARQVLSDQVDELLEHARTTDAFIRALPRPDREARS